MPAQDDRATRLTDRFGPLLTQSQLAELLGCWAGGRDGVYALLRELRRVGDVRFDRNRDAQGRIAFRRDRTRLRRTWTRRLWPNRFRLPRAHYPIPREGKERLLQVAIRFPEWLHTAQNRGTLPTVKRT